MMKRREFLCRLTLVTLVTPLAAEAQEARKIPRVGIVIATSPTAGRQNVDAFRRGLRELGYLERQNIIIEERWDEAGGPTMTWRLLLIALLIALVLALLVTILGTGPLAAEAQQTQSATGSTWEPTPWRAVQGAARNTLVLEASGVAVPPRR
jgi:hypothetical protein